MEIETNIPIVNISSEEEEINIETPKIIKKEAIDIKKYEGKYNITPLAFQQQELETKDKLLEENLIVKEVPFFEVSNVEGITIYIGSEV